MKQISKEQLAVLRKEFPIGCRVELLSMSDAFAPPIGTKGTVQYIDDLGDVGVAWDNGCGLAVAFPEDCCRRCDDEEAID